MKRKTSYMIFLLCIMAFAISSAWAEKEAIIPLKVQKDNDVQKAILPASVEIIEDEAFEGTALVNVELSDKVIQIGEYAFANITSLRDIRIPKSTSHIASTAFKGSNRTTITAPANSYARAFARTHGLPFSPVIMFCASNQSSTTAVLSFERSKDIVESNPSDELKTETQWRRIEEINIKRTEELIANHVQGRSPPMA